jgi:hypothetical protein
VLATSIIVDAAGWVLLPLLMYVTGMGVALLLERVARFRMPDGLLAPVGICVQIVLVMPGYKAGIGVWLAITLILAAAIAGFAWARKDLVSRLNPGWPGIAGLAVYLVYLAPIALSGGWTWGGYNLLNDTGFQLILADHLTKTGMDIPAMGFDTYHDTAAAYLGSQYPLGTHVLLGTFARMTFVDVAVVYHPIISAFAGLGAMALGVLAARSGLKPWLAAVVASAGMLGTLTYQFTMAGTIKEIGMVMVVAVAAALGRELLTGDRPVGLTIALALVLSAGLAVLKAPALAYGGLLAAGIVVAAFVQRDATLKRSLVKAGPAGVIVFAVVSIPSLIGITTFFQVADAVLTTAGSGGDVLGQLERPLLLEQVAGVWLGSYRLPILEGSALVPLTTGFIVLVVALLVVGVVMLAWRREFGPLLLLFSVGVGYWIISTRATAYADAKAMAILSPAVVFVAAFGAAGLTLLAAKWWRYAGLGLLAVMLIGILWSDSYGYRQIQLAPVDRLEAFKDIVEQLPADQEVIAVEREEIAKYFGRNRRLTVLSEPYTPRQLVLRPDVPAGIFERPFDLDELTVESLGSRPYLILRRSPAQSRPPANYELVAANDYYTAWHRNTRPKVLDHLPLQNAHEAAVRPECRAVRDMARRARPGEKLVASQPPPTVMFDTARVPHPPVGWVEAGLDPEIVKLVTPGEVNGTVFFPQAGRYEIWVRGSFGRPLEVLLDGKVIATVQGINTRRQWLSGGVIEVPAGRHTVGLRRPGGRPGPGDLADSVLGPLTFQLDIPGRLVSIDPDDYRDLCGRKWDWIEVVKP